jgi:uncharacterized membrane protein YoaK (UPF0700 family)
MKLTVPVWMSLSAGYVDTAGFLALQGLFTAHVTGNFVTLGAALVQGGSGAMAKLLALPVFCAVIIVTRLIAYLLPRIGLPILRTMLSLQVVLLVVGAVLAIRMGTGDKGDHLASIATGMVLVSAMAIQNAASRVHLGSAPPTTLMTGTTTQIMLDIADLIHGLQGDAKAAAVARMSKMLANVSAFALGCAAGAVLYDRFGMWCFAVPPVLAAVPILLSPTSNPV